jgi:hypothetical protein
MFHFLIGVALFIGICVVVFQVLADDVLRGYLGQIAKGIGYLAFALVWLAGGIFLKNLFHL